MATTRHTYAVRLAVEQGGRAKAELVSVGESGERSLKRIERAGDRASRGLTDLGGRVRFLRVGIGSLAAALAGVVSVGGLAALVNRSLDAADAIAKTADKIGVGVDALQELRFAASLAGIEERTLDMALQRFTRRVAEAAKGTGEAKDALAQMGIALRDQRGNIRAADDLLSDVADAFKRIEDPAERVRLAFKLFDSEGVAMVNVLNKGSEALEETRRRARELGIVLDEELVRNAEKANDQLETLGKVVSANLTRAMLDLAPAIADASKGLAELAADAGVFYEQLKLLFQGDFNFENLSLRSTERIVGERRQELVEIARELKEIGDVAFFDDPIAWGRRISLERRLQERVEQYRQWSAKLASLRNQAARDQPAPAAPAADTTADRIAADLKAVQDRARRIAKIEEDLQRQLFEATHEGAERIRAEYARTTEEIRTLAAPDGKDQARLDQLLIQAAALRDAKLSEIARREAEAANKRDEANRKVIDSLAAERAALSLTERARFVDEALRRLSAEATEEQRRQVTELAGALYDEREAQEAVRKAQEERQKLLERGRDLTTGLRTATESYATELAELNALLEAGAIGQETYGRAVEAAQDRMLRSSREWRDGARRALQDYVDAAEDAGTAAEQAITRGLQSVEDTLTDVFATGRFEFSRFADSLMADITRIAVRQAILAPAAQFLEGGLGGGGGFLGDLFGLFHQGGVVGQPAPALRYADPEIFRGAPRLHAGGIAGGGLMADEVPIIARRGELVVPPEKIRRERDSAPVTVVMNITTPDASSFRASQGQITADLARAVERARRNL
jgi:lambda family phage tail tape measure protein